MSGPVPADRHQPLRFAGYAAVFDRVDRGGDVVRRGAFGALKPGQTIPLLFEHRPDAPIGRVTHASEDRHGLRIVAEIARDAPNAGTALATLRRRGAGLSFGYRTRRSTGTAPRELLDLDVAEISVVQYPMQDHARVHALGE